MTAIEKKAPSRSRSPPDALFLQYQRKAATDK